MSDNSYEEKQKLLIFMTNKSRIKTQEDKSLLAGTQAY